MDLDGPVGRVLGREKEPAVKAAKPFDRQVAVHGRDDDAAGPGLHGPVHHQDVAGVDARAGHGITAGPDVEGGGRVLDAQLVEVERLVQVVLGRARKSG